MVSFNTAAAAVFIFQQGVFFCSLLREEAVFIISEVTAAATVFADTSLLFSLAGHIASSSKILLPGKPNRVASTSPCRFNNQALARNRAISSCKMPMFLPTAANARRWQCVVVSWTISVTMGI